MYHYQGVAKQLLFPVLPQFVKVCDLTSLALERKIVCLLFHTDVIYQYRERNSEKKRDRGNAHLSFRRNKALGI